MNRARPRWAGLTIALCAVCITPRSGLLHGAIAATLRRRSVHDLDVAPVLLLFHDQLVDPVRNGLDTR